MLTIKQTTFSIKRLALGALLSWSLAGTENAAAQRTMTASSKAAATTGVLDVRAALPTLKWRWTQSALLPGNERVMMTPLVMPLDDTNGDGKHNALDESRVVVVAFGVAAYPSGFLHVLRGSTGQELRANTSVPLDANSNPAIADIDGDGVPEIVATVFGGNLIAFNRDLSVKWISNVPLNRDYYNQSAVTISDIDGDGAVELLFANQVFNANGTLKWQANTPNVGGECCTFKANVGQPIVTKLSTTGPQVVLIGAAAFSASGTRLWSNDVVGDGLVAVADLDKNGTPEIVVVKPWINKMYALNASGALLWGPLLLPDVWGAGNPVIADFDGDGYPDIGVNTGAASPSLGHASSFTVVDRNGVIKWTTPTADDTGPVTPTAFDFDANGSFDPMFGDLMKFSVLSGATGTRIFQAGAGNATAFENPVVVDVDADGRADIVVPANIGVPGIGVFSSPVGSFGWAGTRRIWNQHAYSITNINDDTRVPANPAPSWMHSNTFRVNLPIVSIAIGCADGDNHPHQQGAGHTSHGNGNGYGHCKDRRSALRSAR